MKRTQIYLPEEMHHQLSSLARLNHSSISAIIRDSLKKNLSLSKKTKKRSFYDFLGEFIKEGKKYGRKLPRDFSSRHTEYYLETVVKTKQHGQNSYR